MLPRPLLAPLTGSHRRTPVLPHGADLYFDTRCIAAFPAGAAEPTLFPAGSHLAADLMTGWAEPRVFVAMGPLRFRRAEDVDGIFDGAVDAGQFVADRTPFMRGALDVARAAELLPAAVDQVEVFLGVLDRALAQGAPYLAGEQPSLADFAAWHLVWWLDHAPRIDEALDARARVCAWFERRARRARHVRAMPAEQALDVARRSEPVRDFAPNLDDPLGRKVGARVRIVPDDYGRDEIAGELVASTRDEIVVARESAEAGCVHLHFPRIGFQILPA